MAGNHTTKKSIVIGSLGAAGLMLAGIATAGMANAHGYVSGPYSRSQACKLGLNSNCGSIIYEPQSLEGLKGFPAGGPADGQIASAGGLFGGKLDEQSPTRWYKNNITTGPQTFSWTFTAPHRTSKWHYYITKQGWDQNAPLSRSQLEEIAVVNHDGSAASNNPAHVVNIPADRSGYHVVLAVWDVADTVNAFYNAIDVNITGSGAPDTTAPSTPAGLTTTSVGTTSVGLRWRTATDNVGVVRYEVLRNGVRVSTPTGTSFTDTGLDPATPYRYEVRALDAAGNASPLSSPLTVNTASAPAVDTQAPTAPRNLHSMGETTSSISLMWGAATDNVAVAQYRIFRNGVEVARVSGTTHKDTGLAAGTTYSYQVRAVDAAGNVSPASNTLTVATKAAATPTPSPTPTPTPTTPPVTPPVSGASEWNSRAAYVKGDRVTYQGATYVCIQNYQGWGDPNWILAPSLWTKI